MNQGRIYVGKKHYEPNPMSEPEVGRCVDCDGVFTQPWTGRRRKYCESCGRANQLRNEAVRTTIRLDSDL